MPIEVSCTRCGSLLRVGDEHAGASARCPNCENVFPIPMDAEPTPPRAGAAAKGNPFGDAPRETGNPYQASSGAHNPYGTSPRATSYMKPHRGTLILILGILGLVCCQFLGIAAWIMGSNDLKEIDAGVMDPEGRGTTQAGMIIGIIATVLLVLTLMLQFFLVIMAA